LFFFLGNKNGEINPRIAPREKGQASFPPSIFHLGLFSHGLFIAFGGNKKDEKKTKKEK